MSYEKVFIGKGRQVPNMQVARVTIPLEKLQEIAYEKEGVMWCTFEVSKLKDPDRFGREYTAYYSKLIPEVNEPAPEITKPARRGRKPKPVVESDEIPF